MKIDKEDTYNESKYDDDDNNNDDRYVKHNKIMHLRHLRIQGSAELQIK